MLSTEVFAADPVTLIGKNGKVNIGEIGFTGDFGPSVAYFVDVLDPTTEVAAFAVSSGIPFSREPRVSTTFPNWNQVKLHPADWDSGREFSIGGTTLVTTSSLGSASSLFGDDDVIAIFYLAQGSNVISDRANGANDQDPDAWILGTQQFATLADSRSAFIALDINGQVIDYSVPEPSSLALGTIMSLGLLLRRVRKAGPKRLDSTRTTLSLALLR
jgi:hypothetical protein